MSESRKPGRPATGTVVRIPAGDGGPDLYARARALERKLEAIDPRLADELAEALADVMKAGLLLHGELALERTARAVTAVRVKSAVRERIGASARERRSPAPPASSRAPEHAERRLRRKA